MSAPRTDSKKRQAPWFKFWAREWISDERLAAWPLERKAALVQLRCYAWLSDTPCTLPDDDQQLASLSGLGKRWRRHADALRDWFVPAEGRLKDAALAELYEEMVREAARRSEAASRAAQQRWQGDSRVVGGQSPATPPAEEDSAQDDNLPFG